MPSPIFRLQLLPVQLQDLQQPLRLPLQVLPQIGSHAGIFKSHHYVDNKYENQMK